MNRTTPIILLALLILVDAYVVVFELRDETRMSGIGEIDQRKTRVFDVGPSDTDVKLVKQLTIERNGTTLRFERGADGFWRIAEPVTAETRESAVDSVVGDLLLVKKAGDIPKENFTSKGLAAYGLDKPSATVTLTVEAAGNPKEYTVSFGSADPTGQYAYAKLPQRENVMLVEKSVLDLLSKPMQEYRETKFVHFDRDKVVSLSVQSASGTIEIRKSGDNWNATSPYRDRVAPLPLDRILRAIGDMEAVSFPAEDAGNLEPFGLSRPRIVLTFTRSDNTLTTVLIGGAAKEPVGTVYAKLAGDSTLYTTSDTIVRALTFDPLLLRDRHLAWVDPSLVTSFSVEAPASTVVLKKEGRTWKIEEPVKMDADSAWVDAFLRELAGLTIARFPNDAPDEKSLVTFGLGSGSRVTVKVTEADRSNRSFSFGAIDAKQQQDLYARRDSSESVYAVPSDFRRWLGGTYLDFRTRRVVDMSRNQMRKLTILRSQGSVELAKASDGKWRMTSPVTAIADETGVNNLLEQLDNLEAVNFIADNAARLADWGLDNPAYELTIELKAAQDKPIETRTLLIGKEVKGDGRAALLKGTELVFAVSNTLIKCLGEEFYNCQVWQIPRESIQAFLWQAGPEKVAARREGETWKLLAGPEGASPNTDAISEILAAISYIRVNRFESYTKQGLEQYGLDKPRVRITLLGEGGDHTLLIGREKDKTSSYAAVSDIDAIFTLPVESVNLLLKRPFTSPR